MKKGRMNIIIGAQAGSESKGKLSGWLCAKYQPHLLVMTSSPNAGHTIVDGGVKKVSYHLPIGAVMCDALIVLGPASLINMATLAREIKALDIDPARIRVDPRASIIIPAHVRDEERRGLSNIGSTLQGIGECRMSKMGRDTGHVFASDVHGVLSDMGVSIADTYMAVHTALQTSGIVLCETTQGFDLDLEHGIDRRYCTSKMINTSMALAEAGVPPSMVGDVYGVIRPYPIRVNNRTGTSGPYAEAEEITWETVAKRCDYPGDPSELIETTTTTKLPRRVFEFSWERFLRFIHVCAPTSLCLQFANYIDWGAYEMTLPEDLPRPVWDAVWKIVDRAGVQVDFIGTGPEHEHMVDMEQGYPEGWRLDMYRDRERKEQYDET